MITVLEYLVIAAVIGLVVFLIAVFVFGRGEQMAALAPRTSPSELPEGAIGGDAVRGVRFGLALRGYRMSDVDWTLDRLAEELDRLHRRVAELGGEPLPPGVPAEPAGGDLFGGERTDDSGTAEQDVTGSAYEHAAPAPVDDPAAMWAPEVSAGTSASGSSGGEGSGTARP